MAQKKSIPPPATFYEAVWRARLDWTGHAIPVRVEYRTFYIEAYLDKVSKPDNSQVQVSFASLPTKQPKSLWVHPSRIYPSRRLFTRTEGRKLKISEPIEIASLSWLPEKQKRTPSDLIKLMRLFPEEDWTDQELLSAMETDNLETLKSRVPLKVTRTRLCKITMTDSQAVIYSKDPEPYKEGETVLDIKEQFSHCTLCELGTKRAKRGKDPVFYRGSTTAKAMVLAEAPGEFEERDGIVLHPQAPAGGALVRVMNAAGLNQDDFFFTNAVLCRPEPASDREKNGKPLVEHIQACSNRLKRVLHALKPKLIVILGKVAYRAYYGEDPRRITDVLGWQRHRKGMPEVKVYVAYHPSYIVRQLSNSTPEQQDKIKLDYLNCWQEVKEEMERTHD